MSIADRRNSLRKSSIGIDSIRKSVTSLGEGLVAIGIKSRELLKQTRETNQFKSKLIRQDGEFFKRRRENALRKQREDELEASTITGVTKRQGSLVQKSTRGFLGRILDFLGILLLGWALLNLPKIISAFQKLFGLIQRVVGVLGAFVGGMKNFLVGIGSGINGFLDIFRRFNFGEDDKNIKDKLEEGQNNLTKLNKDFVESSQSFANDKDIASAEQVADEIGVNDTDGGGAQTAANKDFTPQQEKEVSDQIQTFTGEEVDILNQGGTLPEDIEPAAASEISDEEARRIIEEEDDADIEGINTATEEEELELTDADVGGADNIEGVNENNPQTVTPDRPSSSGSTSTAAPTMSSFDDDNTMTDNEVEPVASTDKSSLLKPVTKTRNNLQRRRRRRQTIVKVNNKGGGVVSTPTIPSDTKTKTVFIGNSSEKTLLDLQSLNNKHN